MKPYCSDRSALSLPCGCCGWKYGKQNKQERRNSTRKWNGVRGAKKRARQAGKDEAGSQFVEYLLSGQLDQADDMEQFQRRARDIQDTDYFDSSQLRFRDLEEVLEAA